MQREYCTVFALIISISFAFADNLSVNNWSSDDDTVPEMLPKQMRDKSDDEIQKAVFQAIENQLKVISEYMCHMLDPESPYGFFKDEMPISNARTSNPQSDLIFYNNAIRGFIAHNKNTIIIKWVPNQVIHIIEKISNCHIATSDSPNVKHFIEDIVFQQVADRVVRDTHNNITVAIRQVIKPYIIFKNDTDQNFPGTNGKLPSGSVGYSISNSVISGFVNSVHKLKKVTTKMATNTVTADVLTTIHNLDGKFDFKLQESKPTVGQATFTISRIDINISCNILKPVERKTEVVVNQPNVKYGAKLSADIEKTLTNAFIDNVKIQLNTNICKALGQMIKSGK
ncbi:unnamed protein product [Macrosiphum euphorbiae]|uniref:Uncharacterized protein n=1 Tax=Macrosiphum euphorbiae TaxID=13131 RepID=A0AAV0X129_9HEMI|nr:unnamed protein product [Macrosiphum euphorbiae]